MAKTKAKASGGEQAPEAVTVHDRTVDGFIAENGEKWNRAVNGTIGAEGKLSGGVGEKATPQEKLAEYDRLGGFVTKDGRKVKTGSFYDFEAQAPRKEPAPVWLVRVDGEEVEVPVGEQLPIEAQAAEIVAGKKAGKAKGPKAPKPAPQNEDEE